MPWDVVKRGDEYCVCKKGTRTPIKGGCHPTRAEAMKHSAALYVNANAKPMEQQYVFSLAGVDSKYNKDELLEGVWIFAVPYATVQHPLYGEVVTDQDRAKRFKNNFDNKVYGQDIPFTFEHFGKDQAKGYKAAGWVKEVEPRDDGFWWKVAFTGEGADEVLDGAWRYFSAEWVNEYEDNNGVVYTDVISGGALTNKPFYAGMVPLNFSNILDEVVDWEHSEPGSGPEPRKDSDVDEPSQGTRPPSPTIDPGERTVMNDEEVVALREKLGLDEAGDVNEAIDKLLAEVKPIRDAEQNADKVLSFSKDYPQEYERMKQLEESDRAAKALAFSKRYEDARVMEGEEDARKPTGIGFSALTLDKIKNAHLAMSKGVVSEDELSEVLDSITNTGLVDYDEHGTTQPKDEPAVPKGEAASMAFSKKIEEVMVEDKLDVAAATQQAAAKHPELYQAYRDHVTA